MRIMAHALTAIGSPLRRQGALAAVQANSSPFCAET